ncbi:hypothetical protein HYY69_00830 [Candidatus Woesearchaeota archaeon]|nr:hypothetical protein [Candidatus Woesearchaeota archaeon]
MVGGKDSKLNEKDRKQKESQERVIAGIRVIESIVSKVVASPSEILSGLKQILFFYRLIPKKWKEKAFWVFEKLWAKKKVVISTDPEKPEQIYEVIFEDDKLKSLYNMLPQVDQPIMLQGKSMINLIDKGLHSDSDVIKATVEEKYGQRGLNIVNMLTTKNIQEVLDEIETEKITQQKDFEKKFNDWAYNYDSLAVLVSPSELTNTKNVNSKIMAIAKSTRKNYILINISGKMEDCTQLINTISQLKENKELKYENFTYDISDSGFCKSLRGKIIFKS